MMQEFLATLLRCENSQGRKANRTGAQLGKNLCATADCKIVMAAVFLCALWGGSVAAQDLHIAVVDQNGAPLSSGFRWLVEEDATKTVDLDQAAIPGQNLSLSFHTSYMPVVAKGDEAIPTVTLHAEKRYFVSVLPKDGYAIAGVPITPGQTNVTITVNKLPLPTAQISIFVFEDKKPINNQADLPEESGLANFQVQLFEAGGTYGASGGQVTQDAFGNPLGTTYDAAGSPLVIGNNQLMTDVNGVKLIKNLAPGKYTIYVSPPVGADWHQTSTIEGTKGIDAWAKANEPSYFQEFGPPGHHVEIGFVHTIKNTSVLNGTSSITGRVVNLHHSRPPEFTFYDGDPVRNCWVGLNEIPAAGGDGIFTAPCNADGTFTIPSVRGGTAASPRKYQMVVWDEPLDLIFATLDVSVVEGSVVNLLDVPVRSWYGKMQHRVFFDSNSNGFPDTSEVGIPNQAINLRFRDGSIYQSAVTDTQGNVTFNEVFPFFNWFIAEVDFARFKATGATIVADAGGAIPPDQGWIVPSLNTLNPQSQSATDGAPFEGAPYRTETGPVLLEGYQVFLGQTNRIEWGKTTYAPGQNGGISGIVHYATTRAEDDPRYAAADNWEPGIPRVQINLYKDFDNNGVIDDTDGDGVVMLADVDNYPLGWSEGGSKGAEDIDRDANGSFDLHDAVQFAATDSWDDSLPSGCRGEVYVTPSGQPTDCYDGLRNFNQVRPAVFDGGYAFGGGAGDAELPVGTYIVEAVTPPGYEHVKEEDKNVDFGDSYTPSPLALPVPCVGEQHVLPATLTLFPGQIATPFYDAAHPTATRPLCDRKQVKLTQAQNAAADFFMFTEVPVAAHITGFMLDDLANEFDSNAPTFGEKYAPPFLPVSIRDWTGREIQRVYSDQWGTYNALVPSSYSVNVPMPSGVSPNMLTTCMNSPGPIKDPVTGNMVIDPHFNRKYSQFCYTFQYLPGKTTYLDTPVLPIAAYAGANQYPVDCEFADATPVIYSVDNAGNGPWVKAPNNNNTANANNPGNWPVIQLISVGQVEVANPLYDGTTATAPNIVRDYGFGNTKGTITIGSMAINPAYIISWTDAMIITRVPPRQNIALPLNSTSNPAFATGQLMVTRGDNNRMTETGVTLAIGGGAPIIVHAGESIQAAIDANSTPTSALITVAPGTYEELLIMHKGVQLQGWGAASTVINASKVPAEKLQKWRDDIKRLDAQGKIGRLAGQTQGFDLSNNEPLMFLSEEGAGIFVVPVANAFPTGAGANVHARIDGFTITGGDIGGGIMVNGNARRLEISNNRIISNQGTFGGGIRVGHPDLIANGAYVDAANDNLDIHHNHVTQNGSMEGAGAGIALYTGTQAYKVTRNYVCGNYAMGNGGGIGHQGRSLGNNANINLIADNKVLFNQSFNQGVAVSGGGIYVGGLPAVTPGALSEGAGNVTIERNLIQGNQAGAGDGGGIRLEYVNGTDVSSARTNPNSWFSVNILNNLIVDNMAGLAGGGISIQDALKVNVYHTTVANNDSTGTAGEAFEAGSPNQSTAQPAGIVSRTLSTGLYSAICSNAGCTGAGNNNARPYKLLYSKPSLVNDIVWNNRSFYWRIDPLDAALFGLVPNPSQPIWNLAVMGAAGSLTATNSLVGIDPRFVAPYLNAGAGETIVQPVLTTSIATQPAFDEGGNFIDVRFGPLYPTGNYHLQATSPARGIGAITTGVTVDYDGQARPNPVGSLPDAGADEVP